MSTKVINRKDGIVEASVTIEKKAWKENQEKALRKLAAKVQIKGFRKGKVPFEMAKDYVALPDILNEAINLSLNDLYSEVIRENKLQPYSNRPEISVVKCSEDELELNFKVTVVPTCTLGQYKNLDIKLDDSKVTKEEVEKEINNLLEQNSELVLKEGVAEKGDVVVMDFKGYVDGKEFDGGSATNYELTLGSNQFIPGFEDQLVGAASESKVDVNVTFPEQYVKDLAGKDAKFVCMVHEIKTKKVPELNEEFVASLNIDGVHNVEELKKYEENTLKTRKAGEAQNKLFEEVLDKIVTTSTYEIAESVIKDEAEAIKNDLVQQISQNGLTLEQYKEITGNDDASMQKAFEEQGARRLKEYLVLIAIGNAEKITLTEDDLNKFYGDNAARYGMEVEKVKEIFAKNVDRIRQNLIQDKIIKFVIESNTKGKKEVKAPKAAKPVEEKPAEEVKEEKPKEVKKAAPKKATKAKKEEK